MKGEEEKEWANTDRDEALWSPLHCEDDKIERSDRAEDRGSEGMRAAEYRKRSAGDGKEMNEKSSIAGQRGADNDSPRNR